MARARRGKHGHIYLRTFADYETSAGFLLGIYFVTTYLFVAAAMRKDVQGSQQRGIVEIVRDAL
jgi:hypothetical protein